MKYKNTFSRQYARHVVLELVAADRADGVKVTAKLPTGALLLEGKLCVATPFAAGTRCDINADVAGAPPGLGDDYNLAQIGSTPVPGLPAFFSKGGSVTASIAPGAESPTGRAFVHVSYVIVGAENEIQE